MSNFDSEQSERERRLNKAAAKYFELYAAGQHVDSQHWLGQFPDLAETMKAFDGLNQSGNALT